MQQPSVGQRAAGEVRRRHRGVAASGGVKRQAREDEPFARGLTDETMLVALQALQDGARDRGRACPRRRAGPRTAARPRRTAAGLRAPAAPGRTPPVLSVERQRPGQLLRRAQGGSPFVRVMQRLAKVRGRLWPTQLQLDGPERAAARGDAPAAAGVRAVRARGRCTPRLRRHAPRPRAPPRRGARRPTRRRRARSPADDRRAPRRRPVCASNRAARLWSAARRWVRAARTRRRGQSDG